MRPLVVLTGPHVLGGVQCAALWIPFTRKGRISHPGVASGSFIANLISVSMFCARPVTLSTTFAVATTKETRKCLYEGDFTCLT